MTRELCPTRGSASSRPFAGKELPIRKMQQQAVDGILLDYDTRHEQFTRLEDDLRSYYATIGMRETFSERADMLVARQMRNVGQVVMKALCDEELIKIITPLLYDTQSLLLPYSLPDKLYVEGAGHRQTGEYDHFMQTMTVHYLGASAVFFHRQGENGEYSDLWEILGQQEKNYGNKWKLYSSAAKERGIRQLNPPFEPYGDVSDAAVGGIGNNALTIESVLLAHQRNQDNQPKALSDEPYSVFMRRTALARTDFLTLPASTNRNVTTRILPDPDASVLEGIEAVCEDPLRQTSAPHAIVHGKDGSDHWAHASLWNGKPWRAAGNCVADVPHVPTLSGEAAVDNFFELASSFAGGVKIGRDKEGRFRSVVVAHILGALVAEHTLYREAPYN